jgi:hypothetical protein
MAMLALALGVVTQAQAKTETFTLKSNVAYGDEGIFFNTDQGKVALNMYSLPSSVFNSLHTYNLKKGACIQVTSSQGFKHENSAGAGIQSISNCKAGVAVTTGAVSASASVATQALRANPAQTSSRFTLLQTSNIISAGDCGMDSCGWSKTIATSMLKQSVSETLLKATLLGGTSENSPGAQNGHPKSIIWNKAVHGITIRCSYQHPAVIMGSQIDDLPLNTNGMGVPGVLESSARLYFQYCHSDTHSSIEAAIRKYSYHVPDAQ